MTKPKSKAKAPTRSSARESNQSKFRARTASASPKTTSRSATKHARVLSMLRSSTGATIASIMKTTNWQAHSVRGFLAGVVRKRLKLNLVSEQTDKRRIYRIEDGKASTPVAADRAQVAT